jgi:hypothetical protein
MPLGICECKTESENHDRECPAYDPIDVVAHDIRLQREEPYRERLRIANTTESLRNKVLAYHNGFRH